jgi:hypothetical protein
MAVKTSDDERTAFLEFWIRQPAFFFADSTAPQLDFIDDCMKAYLQIDYQKQPTPMH